MFSAMTTLAFALSFFALTSSATPVDTRTTCNPQFGGYLGSNVSIINGGKEWSLKSMPPTVAIRIVPRHKDVTNAEFWVRRRPSDGTYAIEPVGFTDIAVAVVDGKLRTDAFNPNDVTNAWKIHCVQCRNPVQGCTIQSVAKKSQCVELDSISSGPTLLLKTCSGDITQKFEFVGI